MIRNTIAYYLSLFLFVSSTLSHNVQNEEEKYLFKNYSQDKVFSKDDLLDLYLKIFVKSDLIEANGIKAKKEKEEKVIGREKDILTSVAIINEFLATLKDEEFSFQKVRKMLHVDALTSYVQENQKDIEERYEIGKTEEL